MDKIRKSNILLPIIKPFARIWMWMDTRTKKTTEVDFKREEPFVLLGNHVYLFDVVSLAMPWKITPAIVAADYLISQKGLRFLLKDVAKVIPKSKGSSDIRTIKGLIRYIKKGYPVMIMPEGDTTFFGDTGYVEPATAKLIQKLKVDVVIGKFKGGYLAKPRWATGKRKNKRVRLHYKQVINKEDIPNMTEKEIYAVLTKELYHNDYEYQREVMHPYGGSRRAAGLENILYKCPECGALHSIETFRNKLVCTACNTNGEMDTYGFIQGFKYDNLVDWDAFQREHLDELRNSIFNTTATMFTIDRNTNKRTVPTKVMVAYDQGSLYVKGKTVEEYKINDMHNPVLTLRRNLSFDYGDVYYMIQLDYNAMAFLRACQSKY